MPQIKSRQIGLSFDMFGCPNRCRHCYIGRLPNWNMTEEDVRWAVDQFRRYTRSGDDHPFFEAINAVTWIREPDFSDDYKRLYELEVELSDMKTFRAQWELMSIWRAARDEGYAPWAHSIGIRTCQMSFFGVGETQDWLHRRKGAFQDCLIATERLLDAGIKPRWQLFLTRKILPELGEILKLVERLRLEERVRALGGEFTMFIHPPALSGEGRFLDHLRPTIDEIRAIPSELIEASLKHMNRDRIWATEGETVNRILNEEDKFPYSIADPEELFFIVNGGWNVFTNTGTSCEPWWRLGNLKKDPLHQIIENFEQNRSIGLHTVHSVPLKELAMRYGDPNSRLIDAGVDELWVSRYCEEIMGRS